MKTLNVLKSAVAVAALSLAGSAFAVPISVGFNFVPFGGTLTSNTGDITTATSVSFAGGSYLVSQIDAGTANNINLVLNTPVTLTNPVPLTLGSSFTKTFTTSLGTFTETLTVNLVDTGPSSRSITAVGTITGGGFDPTPVFFSASYTQNVGSSQINTSFNNSTVPPVRIPEPTSLALVGVALAGLGLSARRRAAK